MVVVDRRPIEDLCEGDLGLQLDLTEPEAPERLMNFLDAQGLQPDLLINNAGIFDFATVASFTPERLRQYFDLHIRALTRLTTLMAERMAANGGGSILNMGSMSCWMPFGGIGIYAATKAYVRVFTRSYGLEMRPRGVKIMVACPGGIATDLYGLPERYQRLGVRLGVLVTPERFTRGALRALRRGKAQNINGVLNHLAIPFFGIIPEWARRRIYGLTLPRYEVKGKLNNE